MISGGTMHYMPCMVCKVGTKCVTWVITSFGIEGLILGKYSCDCRLTPSQRAELIRLARVEAAVV